MSKQELINAIQATIAANGQKGITAESLANILIEMVNTAGEGGSGGGTEAFVIKASEVGVDDADNLTLTSNESDVEHNAVVYSECAKLLAERKPVSIVVDTTNLMLFLGLPLDFCYETLGVRGHVTGANAEAMMLPSDAIVGLGTIGSFIGSAILFSDGTTEILVQASQQ